MEWKPWFPLTATGPDQSASPRIQYATAEMADSFIPLSVPVIRGNEWAYTKQCLDDNWVSSAGEFVVRFEQVVAERAGVGHAVATVNGTAALQVALRLAGVKSGDEVLVSTLTFIAPVNAIRYLGGTPVFIDAEPNYWQMDPLGVRNYLERHCERRDGRTYNRETGSRVSAIVPVHILGHPVDIDPIRAAADEYGIPLVEDATEALGSRYRGRPVGSLGQSACFSFNGNKIVTTGGGGMLVSDDKALAGRARYLTTQAKDDPVEYIHRDIGYNFRLTNVLAAIGVAQLEQLDEYVAAKRAIAERYREAFAAVPGVTFMREAPWASGTFWLSTALFDEEITGIGSRDVLRGLERANIQARPLWQPIHLSPAHRDLPRVSLPVAERVNRRALSLPCSVDLQPEQQERVIGTILELLDGA